MQASVFPPVVWQIPYLSLNRKETTFVTRTLNSDDLLVYTWGEESSERFCFLHNSSWLCMEGPRVTYGHWEHTIMTLWGGKDRQGFRGFKTQLWPFSFAALMWVERNITSSNGRQPGWQPHLLLDSSPAYCFFRYSFCPQVSPAGWPGGKDSRLHGSAFLVLLVRNMNAMLGWQTH